jgi:hypothetical protein
VACRDALAHVRACMESRLCVCIKEQRNLVCVQRSGKGKGKSLLFEGIRRLSEGRLLSHPYSTSLSMAF